MSAIETNKLNILIVDDEEDITQIIELSAMQLGFITHTQNDPQKAKIFLQENKPEVLVTDLRMPHIDGITLVKEALKTNSKIKILIITGDGKKEDAVEAIRLGVFDFLDKPISMPRLESILRNIAKFAILEKEKDELLNKIIHLTR